MSLPKISNGQGDRFDWHWGYTAQDTNLRSYSLCYSKVGGSAGDVVRGDHASKGKFVGINGYLTREPLSSGSIALDEPITVAKAPARMSAWFAPNTQYNDGDLLVDNGADQVIPLPVGSNQPVIGQCSVTKLTGATEELGQLDLLSGQASLGKQPVFGFGADAPANNKWLAAPGQNHAASAVALGMAAAAGKIRNLAVKLSVAPGGTDAVTYTVHKSSDGGATWSATALTVTITGTATSAVDNTHIVSVSQFDVFAIKVTSSSVGSASISNATFQIE